MSSVCIPQALWFSCLVLIRIEINIVRNKKEIEYVKLKAMIEIHILKRISKGILSLENYAEENHKFFMLISLISQ